ncbi:MAG: hypothetical protein IT184_06695 [Acidobacteria bacterium]|nr:hypothetical protein [Acidobacteriota bacterium]
MKSRHWIVLGCLAAASALLFVRRSDPGALPEPRWIWDGGYWVLIVVAIAALVRRRSPPRER